MLPYGKNVLVLASKFSSFQKIISKDSNPAGPSYQIGGKNGPTGIQLLFWG
jgi:hypothetical protein